MHKSERWPEERETEGKSRPSSRRNSATLSRRGSVKEEKETKRGVNTAPNSNNSTPKKTQKGQNFDFVVTGKQILKRADRASSLPGPYRRPSLDSVPKQRKPSEIPKRLAMSQSSKSRDTSVEEDMSLELSQVSDFEDMNSKYGIGHKFAALATSTPKKLRSSSLHSQMPSKEMAKRAQRSLDSKQSRQSTFSCSRDSLYKTSSSSAYRHAISTELDCSSVSPEYSAPSSVDSLGAHPDTLVSPRSQDLNDSSCCVSTWQECGGVVRGGRGSKVELGEWAHFWAQYNGPQSARPLYDLCPTPYRNEELDLIDFELSTDGSIKRSPEKLVDDLIKSEGVHLTANEAKSILKCAHILGGVVSKAAERKAKELERVKEKTEKTQLMEEEKEIKRKNLTLELRETNQPAEVQEDNRRETVTTQTDISLPNTKSAPKIFEKILRQLSKTSIEEGIEKKAGKEENKEGNKEGNKDDTNSVS